SRSSRGWSGSILRTFGIFEPPSAGANTAGSEGRGAPTVLSSSPKCRRSMWLWASMRYPVSEPSEKLAGGVAYACAYRSAVRGGSGPEKDRGVDPRGEGGGKNFRASGLPEHRAQPGGIV